MLKQGIYEQIITQKLKSELLDFDTTYEIGTEPIDVEEARKTLSAYIPPFLPLSPSEAPFRFIYSMSMK